MPILVEIQLNCGVVMRRWFDDLDIEAAQALVDRFNSDSYIDGTLKSERALATAELCFDATDSFKEN